MTSKNAITTSILQSKAGDYILVGIIGGVIYFTLEVLWRGWSHISMAVCGSICLTFFYYIESKVSFRRLPLMFKAVVGGIFISAIEFVAGLILNKLLYLNIWDYSNASNNFLGQICLEMSIIWILLSFVAFSLCDIIRRNIFLRA